MKPVKLLSTLLIFFFGAFSSFAQKIDTVYHKNGNVLTGDFKKLIYGVVTWKMDGMGTISLETPQIKTIKSKKQFEIKLKNGLIYYGSFDTSAVHRQTYIVLTSGRELVSIDDIVEAYPIKRNFWLRTSGNFSLGINYSKGSDVATIAFSGILNYRKRKSYFNLAWDDNNTFQADTLSSTKADATLSWQRLLKKKWSIGTSVGVAQNSELGTKQRLDFTVIGIRDFIYNKWNRFYSGDGLSLQRETPYDTSGIITNLAGIVSLVWKVYKYTNPKVWVDTDISFVPYLTGIERYRTTFNLNPKISVVGDNLKLGFKFYYAYDTKPPSVHAATSDWGINLELSYSFH